MNKDIFQGDLNFLKGKIKEQWGNLTDDDLVQISGKRDQLVGKLQKRYGFAKEKAEAQVNAWEKQLLAKIGSYNDSSSCKDSSKSCRDSSSNKK